MINEDILKDIEDLKEFILKEEVIIEYLKRKDLFFAKDFQNKYNEYNFYKTCKKDDPNYEKYLKLKEEFDNDIITISYKESLKEAENYLISIKEEIKNI